MAARINKKKVSGLKIAKKLNKKDAKEVIDMATKLAIRHHRKALQELEKY